MLVLSNGPVLQGLDFSLSPGDIASFFDNDLPREVKLKNYAWVSTPAVVPSPRACPECKGEGPLG